MRSAVLMVAGLLLVGAGIVTLVVGMTGDVLVGPALIVAGLVLKTMGLLGGSSTPARGTELGTRQTGQASRR